jgi:hypothetical protein
MSRSPNLKICASSRPWNDFISVIGYSKWTLYVQDLTANDIRLYVQENLEENARFQTIKAREGAGGQEEICVKAESIFLWVYLVVQSMLRGLVNRDEMRDLQRRFHDLEKYFEPMAVTIESAYRVQTARVFRTIVTVGATLLLSPSIFWV